MGPNTRLRPRRDVYTREFEGEIVILDLDGGVYYGLDALATSIWRGMCKGQTIEEVADEVLAEYDVTRDRVFADLLALVNDWVGKGLMEEWA